MSLATRCTQCGTIFKVVQDQLKVSEGWVRCGRCQEVFNALEGLFDLDREAPPAHTPAQSQSAENIDSPPADPLPFDTPHPGVTHFDLDLPPGEQLAASHPGIQTGGLATDDIDLSGLSSFGALRDMAGEPPLAPTPEVAPADALDSRYLLPSEEAPRRPHRKSRGPDFADAQFPHDIAPPPAPLEPRPEPAVVPQQATTTDIDPSTLTLPSRLPEAFQPETALPPPSQRQGKPGTRGRAPQLDEPGFIRQAERRAIWRHPVVRGLLTLLALALSVLLAGQSAHHWRNELASEQPATAPWLAQWCELAGCKLQAPQRIDDLQVDSVQIVRTPSDGEDAYRLTAIVHNRADIALSWPQLDLSLTDANGQVLVRRMFQVGDAQQINHLPPNLPPIDVPPMDVPPLAQTTLQWRLRAPDLKLAGYTAELFYP